MGFSFYLLMPTLPFYLIERFTIDNNMVGLVMSCYVIAALLVRPFSGYMVDTFARKPLYLIALTAFVILTTGYVAAGSIALFIMLRFMHGMSFGIVSTASNTLAIDIMPAARRGEGIGLYGLMLNLSMAVGPMVSLYLYDHYGFNIIFYTAIATSALGLVFAALIKSPQAEPKVPQPLSLDRFILIKAIPIGINLLLISLSYGMVLSFAAVFGKEKGITSTGLIFTMMALGMAASRLFSGQLIDRGHIRWVNASGLAALVAGFAIFTYAAVPLMFFSGALLIGIGYGISFSAFQILFINMGTHSQRGTANSTFFTAFDIGVGIGMIGAGKISAMTNLTWAFATSTAACVLALLLFMYVTMPYYQRNKVG